MFICFRVSDCYVTQSSLLENGRIPYAMITTMKKLKSGYINGTRVTLGNLNDFLSTSSIANLSFLGCQEEGLPDSELRFVMEKDRVAETRSSSGLNPQVHQYLEGHLMKSLSTKSSLLMNPNPNRRREFLKRRMSVRGAIKKTRTINVDCK